MQFVQNLINPKEFLCSLPLGENAREKAGGLQRLKTQTMTPNATIKKNGEILHMWEEGEPIYASAYQAAVNWGVDGIRPETYLVESVGGQKQRIAVRFVEFFGTTKSTDNE